MFRGIEDELNGKKNPKKVGVNWVKMWTFCQFLRNVYIVPISNEKEKNEPILKRPKSFDMLLKKSHIDICFTSTKDIVCLRLVWISNLSGPYGLFCISICEIMKPSVALLFKIAIHSTDILCKFQYAFSNCQKNSLRLSMIELGISVRCACAFRVVVDVINIRIGHAFTEAPRQENLEQNRCLFVVDEVK